MPAGAALPALRGRVGTAPRFPFTSYPRTATKQDRRIGCRYRTLSRPARPGALRGGCMPRGRARSGAAVAKRSAPGPAPGPSRLTGAPGLRLGGRERPGRGAVCVRYFTGVPPLPASPYKREQNTFERGAVLGWHFAATLRSVPDGKRGARTNPGGPAAPELDFSPPQRIK